MRVVVVLGASGFVGRAAAQHLRKDSLSDVVVGIDRFGTDVNADLLSELNLEKAVEKITSPKKISRLTIVNCAGHTVFSDSEARTMDEITSVAQSQLGITIIALNYLVSYCRKQRIPGTAVLVSSIFAQNTPRFEIYSSLQRQSSEIYGATKAGIEQLARYYAKKYGSELIRVNCVSPGGILDPTIHSQEFQSAYSSATALGRMTELEEVVKAIAFLASEDSSGITGAVLPVDCGYGL